MRAPERCNLDEIDILMSTNFCSFFSCQIIDMTFQSCESSQTKFSAFLYFFRMSGVAKNNWGLSIRSLNYGPGLSNDWVARFEEMLHLEAICIAVKIGSVGGRVLLSRTVVEIIRLLVYYQCTNAMKLTCQVSTSIWILWSGSEAWKFQWQLLPSL